MFAAERRLLPAASTPVPSPPMSAGSDASVRRSASRRPRAPGRRGSSRPSGTCPGAASANSSGSARARSAWSTPRDPVRGDHQVVAQPAVVVDDDRQRARRGRGRSGAPRGTRSARPGACRRAATCVVAPQPASSTGEQHDAGREQRRAEGRGGGVHIADPIMISGRMSRSVRVLLLSGAAIGRRGDRRAPAAPSTSRSPSRRSLSRRRGAVLPALLGLPHALLRRHPRLGAQRPHRPGQQRAELRPALRAADHPRPVRDRERRLLRAPTCRRTSSSARTRSTWPSSSPPTPGAQAPKVIGIPRASSKPIGTPPGASTPTATDGARPPRPPAPHRRHDDLERHVRRAEGQPQVEVQASTRSPRTRSEAPACSTSG